MRSTILVPLLIASALFGGGCASESRQTVPMPPSALDAPSGTSTAVVDTPTEAAITAPIDRASERVTKKPFGLYVTQKDSPVTPERFSGYHTGVDFETTADEQNADIVISTICSGSLLLKKWATGYGGVVVQKCQIDGQTVTAIYGHLKLASINAKVGQSLAQGERLGVLGKGYSTETDGERKHLHLGIHKTGFINILGYVQQKSDLSQWLDAASFIH